MGDRLLIWGAISFCWQIIMGLVLPKFLIPLLGAHSFGQLSFFWILLHPAMWLDFSGNINAGLIARLYQFDFPQKQLKIGNYYFATWIWWVLVWLLISVIVINTKSITIISPFILILTFFLPFLIYQSYWVIINWYLKQQYIKIYQFHIFLSAFWLLTCYLGLQFFPQINTIIVSSMLTSIIAAYFGIKTKKTLKFQLGIVTGQVKDYLSSLKKSLIFQKLFVIQAGLGILVLQVDRLIIASSIDWEWVAYYFVPLGILFKLPAFLAVYSRPLISQISILWFDHKREQVQEIFTRIVIGVFLLSITAIVPMNLYLQDIVSLWISVQFAEKAVLAIQFVICLFPLSILLMFGQNFLIAIHGEKVANFISIVVSLFHWLGTYFGVKYWGATGIGFGFISETVGALVIILFTGFRIFENVSISKWLVKFVSIVFIWMASIWVINFMPSSLKYPDFEVIFILQIIIIAPILLYIRKGWHFKS